MFLKGLSAKSLLLFFFFFMFSLDPYFLIRPPVFFSPSPIFTENPFKTGHVPTVCSKYFSSWFYSMNLAARSKEVSIALHRTLPHVFLYSRVNPKGRYPFLKVSICNKVFIFATVYLPKQDQARHCKGYLSVLSTSSEGILVISGDFNLVMIPGRTSPQLSSLKYKL